jgi:hypothetical protein
MVTLPSLHKELFVTDSTVIRCPSSFLLPNENQLGTIGLVVNIIVLWNTIYISAVLAQLRQEGYPVRDEDVARLWLSPFVHERHINLLGRYSFAVPETVTQCELRPLRNPNSADA